MNSRRRVNSTFIPRRFLKTVKGQACHVVEVATIARDEMSAQLKCDCAVARSAKVE